MFYGQYAHARICSVLALWQSEHAAEARAATDAELQRLTAPSETALMRELSRLPDVLARAADEFAPHDLAFYLRDVAAAFHSTIRPSGLWSTMRRWRARASRC